MDRLQGVILAAGLGCFVFAFLLSGLYPYMITDAKATEASIEELAQDVSPYFKELKDSYPVAFAGAFPRGDETLTPRELMAVPPGDPRRATSEEAWPVAYADALQLGRDLYVAEACWHCHSQYVRPVANEDIRFGPVSRTEQDNNALQRPVLWGTRRVGPDLTYEGGRRSNDWHVAHFWDPQSTSPGTVMPKYPWYFREGYRVARTIDPGKAEFGDLSEETTYPFPGIYDTQEEAEAAMAEIAKNIDPTLRAEADRLVIEEAKGPNADGIALITYIQWLGTWDPFEKEDEE